VGAGGTEPAAAEAEPVAAAGAATGATGATGAGLAGPGAELAAAALGAEPGLTGPGAEPTGAEGAGLGGTGKAAAGGLPCARAVLGRRASGSSQTARISDPMLGIYGLPRLSVKRAKTRACVVARSPSPGLGPLL